MYTSLVPCLCASLAHKNGAGAAPTTDQAATTTSGTPVTQSEPRCHTAQTSRAPPATPDAPISQTTHANPPTLADPTLLTAVADLAAPAAPPEHSPVITSQAHPPPELAMPHSCPMPFCAGGAHGQRWHGATQATLL
jgi:hypothetical protein